MNQQITHMEALASHQIPGREMTHHMLVEDTHNETKVRSVIATTMRQLSRQKTYHSPDPQRRQFIKEVKRHIKAEKNIKIPFKKVSRAGKYISPKRIHPSPKIISSLSDTPSKANILQSASEQQKSHPICDPQP